MFNDMCDLLMSLYQPAGVSPYLIAIMAFDLQTTVNSQFIAHF